MVFGAVQNGFESVIRKMIEALDSKGIPTSTVLPDEFGNTVSMIWTVGQKGLRGSGYSRANVGSGNERGHIKAVNEGALDNAVDDSPINIIPQTPHINDPRIKSFEKYRVDSCQGEKVITDMLDNPPGYVRVRVPGKNIDVIYNPISTLSTNWRSNWYLKNGTYH
ncbi:hypothetical protein SAMN04487969_103332 [Paenibacillus algorifonticola]|uniref:Uncharacterized protein n=1 Tax=Paenibacillus algorifonticola TaxID=684063 RepID=A0A1I2BFG9_9BACL|nr:hypothetical protein [Paenibacillus algorifonticola]SFE54809.1 hypothetical protein SAMN04487969_103332 [Paenibacillus algorifonticola]